MTKLIVNPQLIHEELVRLEATGTTVVLFAPIFAPNAKLVIEGRLARAKSGDWRVHVYRLFNSYVSPPSSAILFASSTVSHVVFSKKTEEGRIEETEVEVHLKCNSPEKQMEFS